MKSFNINVNDSGQRLDKFLLKAVPRLPHSMLHKAVRTKKIKVNKKRTQPNYMLLEGDIVELYLNDSFFSETTDATLPFLGAPAKIDIVYEDENILLVNKHPGLIVHEDENEKNDTLINRVQHYLYQNGQYIPENENSFAPALCNRIDLGTAGIVIAAKNSATLRVVTRLIKERKLQKLYLCLAVGKLTPPAQTVNAFHIKDSVKNEVKIYNTPVAGSKPITTKYTTLAFNSGVSLLEVDLITGRTHQIRAQLAHLGHPLLGDNKYGFADINKTVKMKYQALCSYKLTFTAAQEDAEHLAYLMNRTFEVKDIWFKKMFEKNEISI